MTYFTSWEINVFLCLITLGLPKDLVWDWVKNLKETHQRFELEKARDYHCDRGDYADMGGCRMLYFPRAYLSDRDNLFPRAISKLGSIPVMFHMNYCNLLDEFEWENIYQ